MVVVGILLIYKSPRKSDCPWGLVLGFGPGGIVMSEDLHWGCLLVCVELAHP